MGMRDKMSSRMDRIPLIRSLSGSILDPSSTRRAAKSRSSSRSRPAPSTPKTVNTTTTTNTNSNTTTDIAATSSPALDIGSVNSSAIDVADIPPVPPLPRHVVDMTRKIWVKRPGASATLVTVQNDDLVDTVRDVILTKYANSLGRSIDSPDILLKLVTRDAESKNLTERVLGPEELIGKLFQDHFPQGQPIDEALVIEVPQRKTPKPSPRTGNHQIPYYVPEIYRPDDAARDYFGPMAPPAMHSPHLAHVQQNPNQPSAHSMAVLTTGQLPLLPSPGGNNSRRRDRPKYGRQPTSSPTIMHSSQTNGMIDSKVNGQAAPSLPTPPAQNTLQQTSSITPPNRVSSPISGQRPKKKKASDPQPINNDQRIAPPPKASSGLLDNTVPPINVLIVEDNVINLKLLEAFMKRLKVRWKSAMNGREALNMWRGGGFHLVLMDIQLPVMNGLDATREIRRLEAVNGIGVFSGSPITSTGRPMSGNVKRNDGDIAEDDKLENRETYKSPVIIVALTASSLQSDRHEALAAGCNDFLTKPVNFMWMERKVTEWGCMQALIDFDGWRRWKEYAAQKEKEAQEGDPEVRKAKDKEEKKKAREALLAQFKKPPPGSEKDTTSKEKDTESTVVNGAKTKQKDGSASSFGSVEGGSVAAGGGKRNHKTSRSQSSTKGLSGPSSAGLGVVPERDGEDGISS